MCSRPFLSNLSCSLQLSRSSLCPSDNSYSLCIGMRSSLFLLVCFSSEGLLLFLFIGSVQEVSTPCSSSHVSPWFSQDHTPRFSKHPKPIPRTDKCGQNRKSLPLVTKSLEAKRVLAEDELSARSTFLDTLRNTACVISDALIPC